MFSICGCDFFLGVVFDISRANEIDAWQSITHISKHYLISRQMSEVVKKEKAPMEPLFSKKNKNILLGKTDNNRIVETNANSGLLNKFVNVKIAHANSKNLQIEPITS